MGSSCCKVKKEKLSDQYQQQIFYQLQARDIVGQKIDFFLYRSKVVTLIVNVGCKSSSLGEANFKFLNQMHEKYFSQGLEILAFPCSQWVSITKKESFNSKINEVLTEKYQPKFQLFERVEVNGPSTCPVYSYLRRNGELYDRKTGECAFIPGQYSMILLNRNGKVTKFFEPTKKEKKLSQVETAIQKLIDY